MIPKIQARGSSFKGLAAYLTHDPKQQTDTRVAWTHTLNLAHDDVDSAVHEMFMTARNAELLKQEAGIRAGGRTTENPVKHVSLNWAPDEQPNREQMIEAAEDFLRRMKWQEHQTLIVAHDDKEYSHLHLMISAIHPETGLRLNEDFERRRAQAWALDYEREHGRIYCDQRLLAPEEREDAPTRPAWMAFQDNRKKFEREEELIQASFPDFPENQENAKNPHDADWKRLKEIQRRERTDFFADGKAEFSELRREIYREIREEFRERWAEFYEAKKNGGDEEALVRLKAELVAEQKAVLDVRREEACKELRETRDGIYRDLLADQRDIRQGLRARQEADLDNGLFLNQVEDRDRRMAASFRDAAGRMTERPDEKQSTISDDAYTPSARHERTGLKSGPDVGASIATGLGFGLLSFFESIADGLIGSAPPPPPRHFELEPDTPNLFDVAAAEASKRQQQEGDEADEAWRKKQRSLAGE
jgi:hypothetical protein